MGRRAVGRRHRDFKDPLRFLLRSWRDEEGVPDELREYLIAMAMTAVREADEINEDLAGRQLWSDILRLHRCSVEERPGGLARARLVSAEERGMTRLVQRRRGRGPAYRDIPAGRPIPGTEDYDDED